MRKRAVSVIAMLGISLLMGCGQVSEMPDTEEPISVVEQDVRVDKEDRAQTEKENSMASSDKGEDSTSEPEVEEGLFSYEFKEDGTVRITGVTDEGRETIDKEIVIPKKLKASSCQR